MSENGDCDDDGRIPKKKKSCCPKYLAVLENARHTFQRLDLKHEERRIS
jgi:hypothetical protein